MGFAPDVIGTSQSDALVGTAWDERLVGSAGDDRLHGKAGADTMVGGDGDDTSVVDHLEDQALDGVAQGVDRVLASVSFQIVGGVENLLLTGSGDIAATGNGGANLLQGNRGDNSLQGKAGDDTLDGGFGRDSLTGGAGVDCFVFAQGRDSRPVAMDVITDFHQGIDRIDLTQFDADPASAGRQGSTLKLYGSVDGDVMAEFAVQVMGATEIMASDLLL